MNKANPLAVFITCINKCFSYENCPDCTAYSKDYHTCRYSSPYGMFMNDEPEVLHVYSKEHVKIDCRKCDIKGKHDSNSTCVYNHTKILCRLKHPDVK